MSTQTDQQLIGRILAGDEVAFLSFFHRYQPALLRFVTKKTRDEAVAEELVQDIFIHIMETLRDFRYQCSLKTFMYTVARNKSVDYIRKKKIKYVLFSRLPLFFIEQISAVLPDNELERKEAIQKLEKTLSSLPHDYEMILRLKYIEDHPVEHIASMMVRTFKSTESLLFRARKMFIKLYGSSFS